MQMLPIAFATSTQTLAVGTNGTIGAARATEGARATGATRAIGAPRAHRLAGRTAGIGDGGGGQWRNGGGGQRRDRGGQRRSGKGGQRRGGIVVVAAAKQQRSPGG